MHLTSRTGPYVNRLFFPWGWIKLEVIWSGFVLSKSFGRLIQFNLTLSLSFYPGKQQRCNSALFLLPWLWCAGHQIFPEPFKTKQMNKKTTWRSECRASGWIYWDICCLIWRKWLLLCIFINTCTFNVFKSCKHIQLNVNPIKFIHTDKFSH